MTAKEARARRVVGRARRTYLPLEAQRHKPSDYEVTTSALLYYPERGFEVETPVWQHHVEYQRGSALSSVDWEAFEDPAHTTYSSYVAARRDQEAFLDRLYERPALPLAAGLRPWLGPLSALRFFLHGLQMASAYVGALAPSGRISVVAAFQAADELRRIQRVCQWLARSGTSIAELDALGRELWQKHAGFQPLRRLTEELLVTYDWAVALIGLNGVIKPIFDRLWFEQLATLAAPYDDEPLEQTLRSMAEDTRWHEAWYVKWSRLVLSGDPQNALAVANTTSRLGAQAAQAARVLLAELAPWSHEPAHSSLADELEAALARHLAAARGNLEEGTGEARLGRVI
jgi:toluene monooxygenase system protein E